MINGRKSNNKDITKHQRKTWENMMSGKCYTRGIIDSNTNQKVLACHIGNYFSPENCYLAYAEELPIGTCYVDGE